MSNDLITQAGREAAKSLPPVVISTIGLISQGLPFVISFLTLIYLSVQIAFLVWKFVIEVQRKRAIDKAMRGPIAKYKPRIPK